MKIIFFVIILKTDIVYEHWGKDSFKNNDFHQSTDWSAEIYWSFFKLNIFYVNF